MGQNSEKKDSLSSVLNLHLDENADALISSHNAVVEYYIPHMEKRELCHDFLAGNHWTDDEREVARQKKKALVEFNKLKTSERTFVGSMIQQRYDIKPAPREPNDQDRADIYSAMYHWTADITNTRFKDPGLVRDAWAGGNAWQESYVEVTPGRKPRLIVNNENPFAVYPDPNRRDLVDNSDCEFIDRVSWLSVPQLCDAFPEREEEIRAALLEPTSSEYSKDKVHADRSHEWQNYRNGKHKVIERFYKVRKKAWYGEKDGERLDIGYDVDAQTRQAFQEDFPGHKIYMEREEYLYLAIAVPSMGGGKFLFNGEYHCQPRDPVSGKIMFPFVELVDEDLDGLPSGHVAPQIGGIRVFNSLMVNKLFAAKNAAGQSHVVSKDHFDEDVIEDLMENHQDGSRTFPKKVGAPPGTGVELIEQGRTAPDTDGSLQIVASFIDEVSSTPPSMKGQSEGNVAGVLNEQRIQQSFIQTQGFTNNYMGFLARRARLWKYYWKEYWTFEDVIRVLEKKNPEDPNWIAINGIVEDEFGGIRRENTFEDADVYDITFEDSWKSPTTRDKVRQQIIQLQQNAAVQQDPTLNTFLTYYFLQLSDAPQELKDMVRQHSAVIQQSEAQKQQMGMENAQLEQQGMMQKIADAEAQATAAPPLPQRQAPGEVPSGKPRPMMAANPAQPSFSTQPDTGGM